MRHPIDDCGALVRTRNTSMGPLCGSDLTTHRIMNRRYTKEGEKCSLVVQLWLMVAGTVGSIGLFLDPVSDPRLVL